MQTRCCVLTIALLAPCAAHAQTSTVDGVAALTRGDYALAARILRPLAEDSPEPDPVAVFVMATLYNSGLGVEQNGMRACGLYLRAAAPSSPLMAQAVTLAQTIHQDSPIASDLCVAASRGRWNHPSPVSFVLDKDHWVRIDEAGFVVHHDGIQKTAAVPLGGVDWVFLPTRHTQLNVSCPDSASRHFIEFFIWIPSLPPEQNTWTLLWSAFEIVGADARQISDPAILATTTAERPPASFAIDDVITLRAYADGEAEWAIGGSNPRSGVIPSTGKK